MPHRSRWPGACGVAGDAISDDVWVVTWVGYMLVFVRFDHHRWQRARRWGLLLPGDPDQPRYARPERLAKDAGAVGAKVEIVPDSPRGAASVARILAVPTFQRASCSRYGSVVTCRSAALCVTPRAIASSE